MNKSRTDRQEEGIQKYRETALKTGILAGTLNWCTGMGKTRAAIEIKNRLSLKKGNFETIVAVPTNDLKKQWENKLEGDTFTKVYTIQGLLMNRENLLKNKLKCYFLIVDEAHKFAADQFSLLFQLIERTHTLALTATWARLDGKEKLLEQYCPIVDTITLEEARRNGWVADYMEYCLGIELNEKDQELYNNLHKKTEEYLAYFEYDIQKAIKLSNKKAAEYYIMKSPEMDVYYEQDGKPVKALTHREKVHAITVKANVCIDYVGKRKEFINTATSKIEAVIEAVNYFNMKTVTFGNVTETADIITARLGDKARSFHSGLETKVMKLEGKSKPVKVSGKRQCELMIEDFINDKFSVLNTAKKADLGLDVQGLRLGTIYGRTSDPGTHDQRKGRCTRYEMITVDGEIIVKDAIILNIYIKSTKEEKDLKRLLNKTNRVKWINSLQEIQI